mgnify:CR=1 FL=1
MKANWRERVVMTAYYMAMVVEALLYICSFGYVCVSLGGKVLYSDWAARKSTRLNSSHIPLSRMPSSA